MAPRRLTLVALLCLAGLAGSTAVAGAPPPTQLCGVCGVDTLGDGGIDGATDAGTLDVSVDETGDSRWVARVPVNASAAERYADDPAALEAAVDDAWHPYHAADGDVRDVESSLEDGAVVVNYTVPDLARPGVGDAWIVEYFAVGDSNARYQRTADRVSIHAPDGTVVTNRPADATVDGATVTWTGDAEFDEQTYVTYGPDGLRGTASGYATLALEVGPRALGQGVALGLLPGVLLAAAGLAVTRVDWGVDAFDAARLERLLVAVGVVGAVGLLVASVAATGRPFAPGIGSLSVLGVGYAALGVAARRRGPGLGARGLAGLAVLAPVAAGAAAWLLAEPPLPLAELQFGLATALFLPIGYAVGRGARPVAPILVAGLAPITAAAILAPVRSGWLTAIVYWLLITPWLVAVVAFGYPLALLGRRLAAGEAG